MENGTNPTAGIHGASGHQTFSMLLKNSWKKFNELVPTVFTVSVCIILFAGWRLRSYELITPEQGAGYVFGRLGTAAMGILLIYPLRKRVRGLEGLGSIKGWFRFHMVLGIVGPVFILFHCNFQLGSLNSNVALFSMLIVSTSGIMGRYIYSRIHHGLYGQRAEFLELKQSFEQAREGAELQFSLIPGIPEVLDVYSKEVLVTSSNLMQSIGRLLTVRLASWKAYKQVKKITAQHLDTYAAQHHWVASRKKRMQKQIERKTWRFINQALKVSEFNFYERLFALWHMLHLPLVFILAFAIVIHVVAVNRY